MNAGHERAAEWAQIRAAFRRVFHSPAQVGKLVAVALILVAAFILLPRFYWSGDFPAIWQAIGWVAVVGGTGLLVIVMPADASES